MYVYIKSESQLYIVGFYNPEGYWQPESDWDSKNEAAKRVSYLNGNPQMHTLQLDLLEETMAAMISFGKEQLLINDAVVDLLREITEKITERDDNEFMGSEEGSK